jgi:hypothetical protein
MARFPPSLDHAGQKFTPEWLARTLHGDLPPLRSYLKARMPNFGEAATQPIAKLLTQLDPPLPIHPSATADGAAALFGKQCAHCHTALPLLPLQHTTRRLHLGYFQQLLRDPASFNHGGSLLGAEKLKGLAPGEIDALWKWLSLGGTR